MTDTAAAAGAAVTGDTAEDEDGRNLHGFLRPRDSGTLANVATEAEEFAAAIEDADEGSVVVAPKSPGLKVQRRTRGDLEKLVKAACDAYITGGYTPKNPDRLTPTDIIKWIVANEPPRDGSVKPSGGAITEILKRWNAIGYATLTYKPLAFKEYTADAYQKGMTALRDEYRAAKKAERAAEKAAAKAAAKADAGEDPLPFPAGDADTAL